MILEQWFLLFIGYIIIKTFSKSFFCFFVANLQREVSETDGHTMTG